ncbi:putative amidohydrolase [Natrialba magadii ATCC 43099]|uniref:Amidohydrolase n=1 Tax=Natrialba magadii (strain ATCC 43099 / DSM 3394 / CCM 3739 / CIP 104546 / IAM 13178 / JCM 8861 / NBRC 102185 / NCIMB 2190 / MS3) TaxID=547559 RepID=D3T0K2_NATMM|nr:amidohydrolase [Natrialba magadii]ADD06481.1 putative amidohydrolase [Natrialba magadii ATCC 43099]ELY31631.1 amidohydrolase [Natrialba magadii ATCC 43099]
MTEAADLLLTNAEIHSLTEPDTVHEAAAIRDGELVRLGDTYEIEFLEGVETEVIDCEGRTVLPGFIDAHTHLDHLGEHIVHADLSNVDSREAALESLAARGDETAGVEDAVGVEDGAASAENDWILGFGYDESTWGGEGETGAEYLTREDLDQVSETRPIAAIRVDGHTASLNSVALERLEDDLPDEEVHVEAGEPTGVIVEDAIGVVKDEVAASRAEMREIISAAAEHAVELGVTGVHDMVQRSTAARAYRDLAADGDLPLRVRINYWSDFLEHLSAAGMPTNAGSERVQVGAIKSFSDGSFGGETAKVYEPYVGAGGDEDGDEDGDGDGDGDGDDASTSADTDADDGRGQWVVDPDELGDIVDRADEADFQLSIHAIGDEAIEETLTLLESTDDPAGSRHRIEHAELVDDDQLARMADAGIVASMQPNFHRWADEGGLYDQRLGEERRKQTNRFRRVLEAGAPLAFSSDCMPLDPLLGIHHAVTAGTDAQRLSVTEAIRAYTCGGAYAGFDEDRLGTVEVGKRADLVVLEESPWEQPEAIDEIDVAMTLVDGDVVYDAAE